MIVMRQLMPFCYLHCYYGPFGGLGGPGGFAGPGPGGDGGPLAGGSGGLGADPSSLREA